MPKAVIISLKILAVFAILCLLVLAGGFFAVKYGWTNVQGEKDQNSEEYSKVYSQNTGLWVKDQASEIPLATSTPTSTASSTIATSSTGTSTPSSMINDSANWCKIRAAATVNNYNAATIFYAYRLTRSEQLLDRMILAMKLRSSNRGNFDRLLDSCAQLGNATSTESDIATLLTIPTDKNLFAWQDDVHWQTITQAVIKDKDLINKVAAETNIEPRMLVSVLIVEQIRLYYTQRELYEKFFEPLKILANANKMAWGIMSIKEKMAIRTEDNLANRNSPFYPGAQYQHLLDYPADADKAVERYNRLTDGHNHYYSYLYGALILKEFTSQWQKADFDISDRPEILATLFNIGFDHSQPKQNPAVGGSTIEIGPDKYFFGSLAYEFYYSGALSTQFPWLQKITK